METLDLLVFYGEGGYAVDDVGEELEVLGVGGADYVAEENEEGGEGVGQNGPGMVSGAKKSKIVCWDGY